MPRQGHAGRRQIDLQGPRWSAKEYTVWPSQLDFSAELTKAKNSKAESIFVFYPVPPASSSSTSMRRPASRRRSRSIPRSRRRIVAAAAEGQRNRHSGAQEWVNDLPNAENKRFGRDYRKKYPGLRPTYYGAQAYDAAQLINSAVVAVAATPRRRTR